MIATLPDGSVRTVRIGEATCGQPFASIEITEADMTRMIRENSIEERERFREWLMHLLFTKLRPSADCYGGKLGYLHRHAEEIARGTPARIMRRTDAVANDRKLWRWRDPREVITIHDRAKQGDDFQPVTPDMVGKKVRFAKTIQARVVTKA